MLYQEEPSDLDRNIHDYQTRMQSLGFDAWRGSFSTGSELSSKKITNPNHALEFLNYKITEQNEKYSQQASQKARSPYQRPSDLFSHKEENKTNQITSLLNQAEYNNKEGSFKARNASVYQIAISESRRVIKGVGKFLSSSSMSLNSNFQKNNFLKKSKSLTAPLSEYKHGHPKIKGSIKIQKSKLTFKKIRDSFTTLRSTIQVLVYPKEVKPNSNVKNSNPNSSRTQPPQNSNPSNQSLSPGQIQKSLFGPDGRLKSAPLMQCSPLTRNASAIPPASKKYPNPGGANKKPGLYPGRPLTARQTSSRGTHVGSDSGYAR